MLKFLSSTGFVSTSISHVIPSRGRLFVPSFSRLSSQSSITPTPPIRGVSSTQEKLATISDQEKIQAIIAEGRRFIEEAIQSKPDLTHFLASMTLELAKNTDLLKCSQDSLYRAMFACIQLGLEPGPLAHCYFVPRGSKVEFTIGYRGLVLLAHRSKAVSNVTAFCVYENDEFKYIAGTSPRIIHNPVLKNRGELTNVYAIIDLPNRSKVFQVMTKEEVEKHQACSMTKNSPMTPWKLWPEEMWKKTVVRKALKLIPIDLQRQVESNVGSLLYQDVIPLEKENSSFSSLPIMEATTEQTEASLSQEKKRSISPPR